MTTAWLNRYIFFISASIGIALFLALYGFPIVNPLNTQWLLAGGDLTQHYIGWQFFEQSGWTFPIGIAQDLAYPHGLAITFTDSIPLMAIVTKFLFGFVNEPIQYFGIWSLLNFALIASISALIIRRWTTNTFVIICAALLPLMLPIMLTRMFQHTALAGHWILLMGIWILLSISKAETKRFILWWSACLILSVMIHPYFVIMNLFFLVTALVWNYRSLRDAALRLTAPVIAAIVATWTIGGFTIRSVGADDLGKYGFDIASPFNSQTWSSIYGPSFSNNGESVGYLGIGFVLLLVTSLSIFVIKRKNIKKRLRLRRWQILTIVSLAVMLLLVAMSPKVFVGGVLVVEYNLPSAIEKAWSVFRATARIAWPLYYIVLFGALYVLIKYPVTKKSYMMPMILAIVVLLQAIDIYRSPQAIARSERAYAVIDMQYSTEMTNKKWDAIAAGKKHLVYLDAGLYGKDFRDLAELCIRHGMTINNGYFARSPFIAIQQTIDIAKKEVASGLLRKDTVYVYKTGTEGIIVSPDIKDVHELDNFIVISTKER